MATRLSPVSQPCTADQIVCPRAKLCLFLSARTFCQSQLCVAILPYCHSVTVALTARQLNTRAWHLFPDTWM